jgi:ArsR family transcriptional regulator
MPMETRSVQGCDRGGSKTGTEECAVLSYEKISEILKAIAHPTRMEIIVRLREDGCNVSEIQKNLGLPQSTISQHLRILKNAGVLSSRREGTKVCYNVEMKEIISMIEALGRD